MFRLKECIYALIYIIVSVSQKDSTISYPRLSSLARMTHLSSVVWVVEVVGAPSVFRYEINGRFFVDQHLREFLRTRTSGHSETCTRLAIKYILCANST